MAASKRTRPPSRLWRRVVVEATTRRVSSGCNTDRVRWGQVACRLVVVTAPVRPMPIRRPLQALFPNRRLVQHRRLRVHRPLIAHRHTSMDKEVSLPLRRTRQHRQPLLPLLVTLLPVRAIRRRRRRSHRLLLRSHQRLHDTVRRPHHSAQLRRQTAIPQRVRRSVRHPLVVCCMLHLFALSLISFLCRLSE